MENDQMQPRDAWLASLSRSYTGSAVLLTDEEGRVLVVKPNYRPGWQFVGGIIDRGEDAAECARRELLEETGLDLPVGRLLAVAWTHPTEQLNHPAVHFVFDVEPLPVGTEVALQESELEEYRWVEVEEAARLLGPAREPRLRAALAARADGVARVIGGVVTGI
ncbi:NUDIX domain-containing protein [Kitasatospora sp. NPDC006697]|uniref:NUDIX domain-containing protein n=1 Tax=Kitasatospora sp. NPDC006697 TaxID=3364020 RepID=UPI003676C999